MKFEWGTSWMRKRPSVEQTQTPHGSDTILTLPTRNEEVKWVACPSVACPSQLGPTDQRSNQRWALPSTWNNTWHRFLNSVNSLLHHTPTFTARGCHLIAVVTVSYVAKRVASLDVTHYNSTRSVLGNLWWYILLDFVFVLCGNSGLWKTCVIRGCGTTMPKASVVFG